ncbi:iron ABC transporter permease [Aeromicrobium sp. PE09-221]|uniref:FecCD family ABC transporter permease n=1 Tax=Aeromicrobium sp. PE09-221 TaxID=1898043 RepID=UPI000B3EC37A|nr:iron ABC transporter permease [Aeromicrobium sp. PE09-221]OUZ12509.1 iron ABC transporter permease [Aeromicrobium sp. PE09-221]
MTRGASLARAGILFLAAAGLALATLASLFLGGKVTGPGEVLAVLTGAANPYLEAVLDARIDRTLMGVLCGSALAVSGVIIQGITRNPLGDPGLLGVTVGSAAAVVSVSAVTGAGIGGRSVWVAFAGALVTVVIVYAVGARSASGSVVSLLLTGAVVSAVLTAYIQAMILTNPGIFDSFRFWVIGSLSGRDAEVAAAIAPALIAGMLLALLLAPSLNNLALGEDVATSLGTPVALVRAAGILASALLAAAATAAVGPIAFVGLVVPHLTHSIIGADHRWRVPVAAILGAALLVVADIIGRIAARPEEIMVGIVTALVGAPFLLFAVRKGWAAR